MSIKIILRVAKVSGSKQIVDILSLDDECARDESKTINQIKLKIPFKCNKVLGERDEAMRHWNEISFLLRSGLHKDFPEFT